MLYKTIYHGSYMEVSSPDLNKCKTTNDYGRGFYCTENIELAKEWASKGETSVVNKYGLFTNDLEILNLKENNVLEWLTILIKNRIVDFSNPVSQVGYDYLVENFSVDISKYDVIIGYRADDSYFAFVRGFLSNSLGLNQLKKAMKLGQLGEQIVIMTEKGLNHLKFLSSEKVDTETYKQKRIGRDAQAKKDFEKLSKETNLDDIYLIDIIRERIKSDDPRIR